MNNSKLLPALLVFAEVATQHSFTAAARRLGTSKSTVSQQIKRLEAHIGQQLLSRHTRGMSLTAAGRKLLGRCELLQGQVELALEAIDLNKTTPSGVFALTVPHACERDIAIPALRQLCIEFPDIEPRLIVTDEARDLIRDKLDVAIFGGQPDDSSYRALPIAGVSERFYASADYLHRHPAPHTPDQLATHRLIAAPWQGSPLVLHRHDSPDDTCTVAVRYFATTNTLSSVVEMVLQGMGMALLPEFVVQRITADATLADVLPDYRGRQWPFYLLHRFRNEKPVHVTRFYQLAKYFFAKAVSGVA